MGVRLGCCKAFLIVLSWMENESQQQVKRGRENEGRKQLVREISRVAAEKTLTSTVHSLC